MKGMVVLSEQLRIVDLLASTDPGAARVLRAVGKEVCQLLVFLSRRDLSDAQRRVAERMLTHHERRLEQVLRVLPGCSEPAL